jgi:hypothetical protein
MMRLILRDSRAHDQGGRQRGACGRIPRMAPWHDICAFIDEAPELIQNENQNPNERNLEYQ